MKALTIVTVVLTLCTPMKHITPVSATDLVYDVAAQQTGSAVFVVCPTWLRWLCGPF